MSASESIVVEGNDNGKRTRSENEVDDDLPFKSIKTENTGEDDSNGKLQSQIAQESSSDEPVSIAVSSDVQSKAVELIANDASDEVRISDVTSKSSTEWALSGSDALINVVGQAHVAAKPQANDPRKPVSVAPGAAATTTQFVPETAPQSVSASLPQVVAAPATLAVTAPSPHVVTGAATAVVEPTRQVVTAPTALSVAASAPHVFTAPASQTSAAHVAPASTPQVFVTNSLVGISDPNLLIEEKGEVSPLYVGRVIGKGGEMIRDLQARSGARIDVDQNVPPGHPRVITYKGTRQTVEFAKQLVAILSREGASENDLPLGHASLEHVVIPSRSVGKVIGRNGEMIRELQSRSQAKIQIDHTGRSGHPPDQKLVTITGTKEAVSKGAEMVRFLVANPLMDAQQSLNMLMEDKARTGLPWGSGPPYPNLPSQGMNMNPQASQSASFGSGGGYQQFGSGLVPPPVSYGGTLAGSHQHPFPAASQDHRYGGASGGREVEMIHVSKQYMGRIIGGKGVTINDLQRRSACEIQINQDVPPGKDCEITLKGTRPAIETAKLMINTIIETGPQHPYAGGADTYGGANNQQQQINTFSHSGGYQHPPYEQNFSQPVYGQPTSYMQQSFGQPAVTPSSSYGNYAATQPAYGAYNQQNIAPVPSFQQQPLPQPKAPPPPMMLSPWKAATAPDGQIYYYNERTGETQWEKPAGMP